MHRVQQKYLYAIKPNDDIQFMKILYFKLTEQTH